MKQYLFLILSILTTFSALADNADSSAVFKADFYKHELQQYDVSLSSYDLKGKDTTALETVMMKADVYISDSTGTDYIISWKFHDFSIDTNSSQLKRLIGTAKPVNISYRTSRPGVLNEFINWKETSESLDEGMKAVVEEYANKGDSASKADIKRIFTFRESFESAMLRSIRLFHQAYGLGYNLGEEVDVPADIQGTASQLPVKGVIRKKLIKVDRANGVAELSTASIPDKDDLKKKLSGSFPKGEIPSYLMSPVIIGGLVSDLNTGWVIYTFEQEESGTAKGKEGEILEIQHIDPKVINNIKNEYTNRENSFRRTSRRK